MRDKLIQAQVERITPLTNTILQLILAPQSYIEYQAGQYLQIISGEEAFSYSIANAPLGSHKYELHIRHSRDNPYNQSLLTEIKRNGSVAIRLPLGECHVNQLHPEKPIIFVAAGTGFAPIKAMIEQLLANGETRSFELFWSARSHSDLYMDELVLHWQTHVANFHYFSQLPTVSKVTLANMLIEQHQTDLKDWQIVIGGPFDMAYSTRDQLVQQGIAVTNLFSDAFSFEGAL